MPTRGIFPRSDCPVWVSHKGRNELERPDRTIRSVSSTTGQIDLSTSS
nr:MAG TPA: hypothetical protein [Caudoviricetes sp.]